MAALALNMVVIYSEDVERALQFYRAFGLSFTKEKHGRGPEHYAAEVGPTVFEIYPSGPEAPSPSAVRLGFRVASVETSLAALAARGMAQAAVPRDTPWGRRAVVTDPDGRRVEISE
jgi:predicted enzyme related to lactoylglutathione lyase